jgi:hypothetical protein
VNEAKKLTLTETAIIDMVKRGFSQSWNQLRFNS